MDLVLVKDFASFALQVMEIHPIMILIRTLSMILQTISLTLYNPNTRHTYANYVGTILTLVMIVHHGSYLSMSRNRATIKTNSDLIIIHKIHRVLHNNIFVVKAVGVLMKPSRRFNYFYDDDDDYDDYDYEERSIPLRDIISKLPSSIAITPILLTLEPEDSLIMGNEELSTIPEKQSDEFIKSSTGGSFSNPNDDESLSDEDVPEDNIKIYSNPLFEFDDKYISSDVNPLFDEVLEDSLSKDSYVSNLDETALLVTPLSDDDDEDECFDPGGDVDEIEFLLRRDPSTPKISIASILEWFTDEPPIKLEHKAYWALKHCNFDLKTAGWTFTIVGNSCRLTIITSTKVEPLKETTSKSVTTPNPEIKIYRRKTKVAKSVDLSSEPSILGSRPSNITQPNKHWGSTVSKSPYFSLVNFVLIVLWYLDFGCSKHMTGYRSQLINFVHKYLGIKGLKFIHLVSRRYDAVLSYLSCQKPQRPSLGYGIEGKSKKHTQKPKAEDSIQEKLYLLHSMRIQTMASEQFSSGPGRKLVTPGTFSSGLVPNPPSPTPYVPPIKKDWDTLFQPMFDEYFTPSPSIVSPVPTADAPRPAGPTGTPSSTIIDQDAPSPNSDPFFGVPIPEPNSEESSSGILI
ncbi:hypothetical protein Tco_0954706 [Tanacetum coccineum]|uniref:Uncharacterized protein n=1 Tax=Tanacetum coccineum TaxID=301880 RepID=A0ABQ5E555_9ASTR